MSESLRGLWWAVGLPAIALYVLSGFMHAEIALEIQFAAWISIAINIAAGLAQFGRYTRATASGALAGVVLATGLRMIAIIVLFIFLKKSESTQMVAIMLAVVGAVLAALFIDAAFIARRLLYSKGDAGG